MKKVMIAVVLSMICSGIGSAQSMAGKLGVGLRNTTFDVRYFVTNNIGVHAGTSMNFTKPSSGSKSSEYVYDLGGFYSKEITDGLLFQTGMTVTYDGGKDAGTKFTSWAYNPFLGAEFVYKGRFGLDFKVIPIQYVDNREKGRNSTSWAGGYGSFGAHLYFY